MIRRAATIKSYSEAKTPAKTRPWPPFRCADTPFLTPPSSLVCGKGSLGYRDIPADVLMSMRIHGVSIDDVKKMKARFNNVSVDDLVEMKIHGRS